MSFRGTSLFPAIPFRSRHTAAPAAGGDEQNRTVDPLLARQVLSQLSYTPISTGLLLQGEYVVVHRLVKVPAARCKPRSKLPVSIPSLSRLSASALQEKTSISAVFPLEAFKIKQRIEHSLPTPQMKFPSSADLGFASCFFFTWQEMRGVSHSAFSCQALQETLAP